MAKPAEMGERGDIPMHRNPANGYRLFLRDDLEELLRKVESTRNAALP